LPTVESVFQRAKFPERIRVAIVDQRRRQLHDDDPSCRPPTVESCRSNSSQVLCQYRDNIDWIEYDAELMTGPIFARHLAYRMYRGEYFALQVDSHVRFVADWDDDIISQWHSTGNEMAVISTYLNDITNSIDPETHQSKRTYRAMMCDCEYEWKRDPKEHIRFKVQPTNQPKITNKPMLQPFWAAGFSFARGHFLM
jgi:[Skp1-protein]-hydroxyproline N-acetylglucosaminyltransferase